VVNTIYTITGTNGATGCMNTGTVAVVYTPAAPLVSPPSAAICLNDVQSLSITSSLIPTTQTFNSGPISVVVPDNGSGDPALSGLTVSGIPAGANISQVKITMNMTHTYVGDMDINIVAPNNAILNLVGGLNNGTGSNSTANFTNTAFSSLGGAAISGAPAPRTGTFAAEARAGYGPNGFIQTVNNWAALTPTAASANGLWSLAMGDFGAGDQGTLTSWSIAITYGVPASGVWTPNGPGSGLYTDATATTVYNGASVNTVYAKPTPAGVYPYQVTVQSQGFDTTSGFSNPALITIPSSGTATPYPSNIAVSGLPTTGVSVSSVILTGVNHTWSNDIDILLQSPTGQNVILMSDVGGTGAIPNATYTFSDAGPAMSLTAPNPTGTYHPTEDGTADNWPAPGPGAFNQANPALALFGNTANPNGAWKLFVVDDTGGDQGTINGGWAINFTYPTAGCVSPARTVVVTVNQPAKVTAQPVNKTVCTDKVATFTVAASGTAPFSYRWQVSTDNGNNFSNISNGGVYSGATSATLSVTQPPVSMSGYQYRVFVQGALPCGPDSSSKVVLTVNPLPTIVITAAPYTRLYPGLVTTLSSTVSPAAAASYTWLRNGAPVAGAGSGTLSVDVDRLGDYVLSVTDVNGCTNTSNMVSITDSITGKCYIYPNPNTGQFQVRYYSAANNVLPRTLSVYDGKGDRILTQNYTIGRPYDRMDVDLRKNGKGLYWVEIGDRNGNRLTMCRVVIQ
jgi:subtilisin-like proprotein convertase family protein